MSTADPINAKHTQQIHYTASGLQFTYCHMCGRYFNESDYEDGEFITELENHEKFHSRRVI